MNANSNNSWITIRSKRTGTIQKVRPLVWKYMSQNSYTIVTDADAGNGGTEAGGGSKVAFVPNEVIKAHGTKLRSQGQSNAEIAKTLNIEVALVDAVLGSEAKANVEGGNTQEADNNKPKNETEGGEDPEKALIVKILELDAQGKTPAEIAKLVGRHHTQVKKLLKDNKPA